MNARELEAQLKTLLNISPPKPQQQAHHNQVDHNQQQSFFPAHSQLLHELPPQSTLHHQSLPNVDPRLLIDPRMAMIASPERDPFLEMRMRQESEGLSAQAFAGAGRGRGRGGQTINNEHDQLLLDGRLQFNRAIDRAIENQRQPMRNPPPGFQNIQPSNTNSPQSAFQGLDNRFNIGEVDSPMRQNEFPPLHSEFSSAPNNTVRRELFANNTPRQQQHQIHRQSGVGDNFNGPSPNKVYPIDSPRQSNQMQSQRRNGYPEPRDMGQRNRNGPQLPNQDLLDINCIRVISPPPHMLFNCDLCRCEMDQFRLPSHIPQTRQNRRSQTKHDEKRHDERLKKFLEYILLAFLPEPSPRHSQLLTMQLHQNLSRIQMHPDRQQKHRDILNLLQKLATTAGIQGIRFELFGSTMNGFGLGHSNVNINMSWPEIENNPQQREAGFYEYQAQCLMRLSQEIRNARKDFRDLRNDLNPRSPRIYFTHFHSRLNCELTTGSEKSWKTSQLLKIYASLDERVRVLGLNLRGWAQVCEFDKQENGTWPPHTFPIMVIHFLQRCDPPVVPCLHEIPELQIETTIEVPGKAPDDEPIIKTFKDIDLDKALRFRWKSQNTQSSGELWLQMLRYYVVQFNLVTDIVSIRTSGPPESRSERKWDTRVFCVEDPCRPTINLSRSVGNMKIYDEFMNVLRDTYRYYAIPLDHKKEPLFSEQDFGPLFNQTRFPFRIKQEDSHDSNSTASSETHDNQDDQDDGNQKVHHIAEDWDNYKRFVVRYGLGVQLIPDKEQELRSDATYLEPHSMAIERLSFFRKPSKFCRLCHKTGHVQANCPVEKLPDLVPLEPMTPNFERILNEISRCNFMTFALNKDDEALQNLVISDLRSFIREKYSNAELELFGSARNGFGQRGSDLDICLTFEGISGENIDAPSIISEVSKKLETHRNVSQLLPITTAKVPIVKFHYRCSAQYNNTEFECDISCYNILAKYNTKMLKTYCDIDPRVRELGLLVKHFVKTCDICDASRGSLSSYAYILMLIYFLQQIDPPVLPVLQQIGRPEGALRKIGEWDTWFFEDIANLNKYWPHVGKNTDSVAQLFLGFLRFYAETFNYKDYVICCRQLPPLLRTEKMWGKKISIEDPFEHDHNLGSGVDDHMAAYIKTAFVKGRNLFGKPPSPNNIALDAVKWHNYLFDPNKLTEGVLPTGRGCRICGKIGHKVKDCPAKKRTGGGGQRNRRN